MAARYARDLVVNPNEVLPIGEVQLLDLRRRPLDLPTLLVEEAHAVDLRSWDAYELFACMPCVCRQADELGIGDRNVCVARVRPAVGPGEQERAGREHLASLQSAQHAVPRAARFLVLVDREAIWPQPLPVDVQQHLDEHGDLFRTEEASESFCDVFELHGYLDADSAEPTAACPAARRAVSTRNGEQLT